MVTPPLRTGRGGMLAALLLAALCAQAAGQSTPSLPKSLSDCLKKAAVRVVAPTGEAGPAMRHISRGCCARPALQSLSPAPPGVLGISGGALSVRSRRLCADIWRGRPAAPPRADKSYAYNSEVGNKLVSYSKPKGVAFPTSGSQVAAAVKCAAAANVRATPRCGGHGYEGYAVLNNTLTIDVSGLDKTTLSADQTTATVGGGSTLGKAYYYVWQQSGGKRAMVGGTCPAVGAGGHIPGGGLGYLTRQYGLACDQVVQVKVVDAKGSTHTATKAKNSDLFWASCGGGGGNFGIITEFKVKTVPLPPNVTVVELGIRERRDCLGLSVGGARGVTMARAPPPPSPSRCTASANAVPFLQFWQKWAGSVDSKFTTVVNPGARSLFGLCRSCGGGVRCASTCLTPPTCRVVHAGSPVSFSGVYLGSKAEATKLMKSSGILTKFAPTRVSYKEMSYINSVILHACEGGGGGGGGARVPQGVTLAHTPPPPPATPPPAQTTPP